MWKTGCWLAPVLTLAWGVCAAQTASFSGNWRLNVSKSRWGSVQKPLSVTLYVEHREPVLEYRGQVIYANEDTRDFAFTGQFDGKEYAMVRSVGAGTITLTRVDAFTFDSVFRTDDHTCVETARTSISRDGRTLTRRLRLQTPQGTKSWTEVYERY